jgi:hypothetical protein
MFFPKLALTVRFLQLSLWRAADRNTRTRVEEVFSGSYVAEYRR